MCQFLVAAAKKCNPGEYPGRGTPKEPYCNPNQMPNTSLLEAHGKVHTRFIAGETVDLSWMVSAPHGGHYQYRLCLDGTDTEECFKKTPLLFADGSQWHGLEWPCDDCTRKKDQFGRYDNVVKVDKVVIPKDIQCERCTLGWRWDASTEPTIFTSCADVSISAPASSPSPTPAPNPIVEDHCVDELWQRCGGKMKCCKPNMTCRKVDRWVSQCEPDISSNGGCCKWGGSCGDCGNDGTGWCHKSASNCKQCTGSFDASAKTPSCRSSMSLMSVAKIALHRQQRGGFLK